MKTETQAVLIIIDMIKGFVSEGLMADSSIGKITPVIIEQIDFFLQEKNPILAFIDSHQKDSLEFKNYPIHCLKGSSESELIDELLPYKNRMILIEKDTTNGLMQPEFLEIIKQYPNLKKVVICGCCSDICVLQFALSFKTYLIHHRQDIELIVLEDGVDTFHAPGHDKEEFNKMALTLMRNASIAIQSGKKEK